jgi:uncharacterized membrane protein
MFFTVSGLYLGLVLRFNSWDMLTRPGEVIASAVAVADRPRLLLALLLFGGFLWAAYEAVEIWIDGFLLRWSRLTRGPGGSKQPMAGAQHQAGA